MNEPTRTQIRCDGVRRRDWLRFGGLALLGRYFARTPSAGADPTPAPKPTPGKAKSCILLWLDGGPSHLEMWDPKPDAPAETRGPFGVIAGKIPGIFIGEHLPLTAAILDKIALIRSLTSPLGEHGIANHYMMTGYPPSPVLQYPSYGSVVAHVLSSQNPIGALPPYVAIPEARPTAGAGFLGALREPFSTGGDPSRPDFHVRDLNFFPGVNAARLARRRDYLALLDQTQARLESAAPAALDPNFEQAYTLATSPEAKRAFDLDAEKPGVRARYGPRMLGQSCLLARRLVERGVPFVTILNTGWDTHANLSLTLRDGFAGAKVGVGLIPTFDQAFSALIEDLEIRGLLDETLVIAMGEFGRTPKLNTRGGRDHWPRVFSAALAGGGIRGGQVIGASDPIGESPRERPITPADLARTIYAQFGIPGNHELHTNDGRPIPVNQGGRIIGELG